MIPTCRPPQANQACTWTSLNLRRRIERPLSPRADIRTEAPPKIGWARRGGFRLSTFRISCLGACPGRVAPMYETPLSDKDAFPKPILPAHIEETIRSIAQLHAEHRENATPLQRAVDRVTA